MASSLAGLGRQNAFDAVAAEETDSSLVAAVPGRKIVVNAVVINHGDTTASSVTFNSGSTPISPPLKAVEGGGFVIGDNGTGWFGTTPGEALTVTTSAGSTTSIIVTYSLG